MSSIKATQIDGDVSVGRDVAVGGKVTVQGRSHFKGNVKVEGWLDAKNIKGANKGIFTSVKKLKEAYPLPHDGWWAIVGTSLPGPIYVGDGGEWVATGESGGVPSLDCEQLPAAIYTLDITGIETMDYVPIGERGFTEEFIKAMGRDAVRNFSLLIKQGENAARCSYGGFFAPYGQPGGKVYIISLNHQTPQHIQLRQESNRVKVIVRDMIDGGAPSAEDEDITILLNTLN